MTYTMSGPTGIAHVLAGVAASLQAELPHTPARQVADAVQNAQALARVFLPDLSIYTDAVVRLARSSLLR